MSDVLTITEPDRGRFETLLIERSESLLVLTLNRPDRLNAVGGDMHEGLETVFSELRHDRSVRAVLLRGAGRAFCVGGDIKSFAAEPDEPPSAAQRIEEITQGAARLVDAMLNVPQPIVAAVQGYAMGLGATLALMCDVVLAADNAQLADTHVPVGLVAGDGGALAWPLSMSMGAAKYYLMTGDRLSGVEAARLGLVLKAVPEAELQTAALAVASKLAGLPPLAVQGTKSTLNRVLRHRAEMLIDHGLLLEGATFLSDDHKEAASAFIEKRRGVFRGR
ncbi:enoyl-CoA hydratase/isomerase family protein [Paraburkholderia sp. HP33-1]|uniref:enoyl-CoA hydratase/isomerase family protein n=1 Tax=Paraburkholderia sp. HP33-1 TaxID=2883243 RepID=UPI001F3AB76E|nr:enoyl-CoA hydratase-related protein [Paraburkholderia sp. HP33-1]